MAQRAISQEGRSGGADALLYFPAFTGFERSGAPDLCCRHTLSGDPSPQESSEQFHVGCAFD
jgi:hypothetical protein